MSCKHHKESDKHALCANFRKLAKNSEIDEFYTQKVYLLNESEAFIITFIDSKGRVILKSYVAKYPCMLFP